MEANIMSQYLLDYYKHIYNLKNMVLKKEEPGAGKGGLADISVDEMLQQNIHMDVTVENIEDDD